MQWQFLSRTTGPTDHGAENPLLQLTILQELTPVMIQMRMMLGLLTMRTMTGNTGENQCRVTARKQVLQDNMEVVLLHKNSNVSNYATKIDAPSYQTFFVYPTLYFLLVVNTLLAY